MRGLLLVIWLVMPQSALALSCLPHNAISAFLDADRSTKSYVAVLGRLSFDASKTPKPDQSRQRLPEPDNFLSGRISGHSLTQSGFDAPFDRAIDINLKCMGPWCARLRNGQEQLVYLERTDGRYLLVSDPCGGYAFATPDPATLDKVRSCMRGEACDPELPRR